MKVRSSLVSNSSSSSFYFLVSSRSSLQKEVLTKAFKELAGRALYPSVEDLPLLAEEVVAKAENFGSLAEHKQRLLEAIKQDAKAEIFTWRRELCQYRKEIRDLARDSSYRRRGHVDDIRTITYTIEGNQALLNLLTPAETFDHLIRVLLMLQRDGGELLDDINSMLIKEAATIGLIVGRDNDILYSANVGSQPWDDDPNYIRSNFLWTLEAFRLYLLGDIIMWSAID